MKRLNHKIVIHIPMAKWTEHGLQEIDISPILDEVENMGLGGWYENQITGHYQGRSYQEKTITVFVSEDILENAVYKSKKLLIDNHDLLCQEEYAIEVDGTLLLISSMKFDEGTKMVGRKTERRTVIYYE